MSDEKALLAAIWEHPNEDTPRLVYADWLQENGQPERAEFIRQQIDVSLLPERDPAALKCAQRARELLDASKEIWAKPFAWVLDGKAPHLWSPHRGSRRPNLFAILTDEEPPRWLLSPRIHFVRGFIDYIRPTIDVLLKQSPESLIVSGPRPHIALDPQPPDTPLELPAALPELCERLTLNNFTDWEFTDFGGFSEDLIASLSREERLMVGQVRLEVPDLENTQTLTNYFSVAPRLEELALHWVLPSTTRRAGLGLLAAATQSGLSKRLKKLSVGNLYDEDELTVASFFTELARHEWPQLEELTLSGRNMPQSPDLMGNPFPRLRKLSLDAGNNETADDWLPPILESPTFRNVSTVHISGSLSESTNITALLERFGERLQID